MYLNKSLTYDIILTQSVILTPTVKFLNGGRTIELLVSGSSPLYFVNVSKFCPCK